MHGGYTPCLDSVQHCLPTDVMCGAESTLNLSCAPWLCVGATQRSERRNKGLTAKVQLLSCRRGLSSSMLNLQTEALLTSADDDDDGEDTASSDYDVILSDSDVRLSDFDLIEQHSDASSVTSHDVSTHRGVAAASAPSRCRVRRQ